MLNKATIIGHLGGDPTLRSTSGGTAVANFSVATTERWKDRNGEKQERTEWHSVVAWGVLGENCERYLRKGSKAYVEGRLQTREWEDREGQKRRTTEIVAMNVVFLDPKDSSNRGDGGGGGGRGNYQPPPHDDDDVPF